VIDLTDLEALDEDASIVLACARVCGISAGIGVNFVCVLPGHEPGSGGATLWREPAHRRIIYRDLHGGGEASYTLAEVYACRHRGRTARIQGPVLARWKLKLLHAAGLIEPLPVRLPRLGDTDDVLESVMAGLTELVELRRLRDPGEEGFTFSRRFAAEWCQVPEMEAYAAINRLIAEGVLVQVGVVASGYPQPTPIYVLRENR
jgi:hypothetical protein